MRRTLIVNADDFGQSPGVNRGVIEAHESGIVTSASLMVRWPATDEAVAYARARPALSVGLHVDLGEWARRDGEWVSLYEVDGGPAEQIAHQVARLRELMGRDPSHLDSHQHVHRKEPVHSIMVALARELDVPLRSYSKHVRYCGDFYGQAAEGEPYPEGIRAERLVALVAALPLGTTELGCHPGLDDDVDSMYRTERSREVAALCDPRIRTVLLAEGIELRSFLGIHA
jgi:predicted glycoside hydrolase/deacetylase ChbG (UPF0249 family)